ncbi:hypothetical protein HFP57_02720 [Parasphingopyxis algicola]|uniref:hypothetical protein n=1 Tax=Parasphingopyxis algicola TaxID=2026624 RepID=UPI00159F7D31|nr:hypothetical protein [Parasphingopyxis algicola]QLC24052.1 hypothetical protein HFP57_02720 [Parasphingopyxis algicola]
MRRMIAMTAAVTLLAGCGGTGEPADAPAADTDEATSEAPGDGLLTAEGWGPLRIGMTRDEVTAAVGGKADPDAMGGPEPELCEEYQPADTPEGLYVMIEQGSLARITLAGDTEVRTTEGITVGDGADQVRAAYGEELRTMPHTYVEAPGEYLTAWTAGEISENGTSDENARGIRYEIGQDGIVQLIHAGGPAIQYVEGCL